MVVVEVVVEMLLMWEVKREFEKGTSTLLIYDSGSPLSRASPRIDRVVSQIHYDHIPVLRLKPSGD